VSKLEAGKVIVGLWRRTSHASQT